MAETTRVVLADDDVLLREGADDPLGVLSERDSEVLALMAEGRSNAGIAHRIWVTEGMVEKHVRSIMHKLSLRERWEDRSASTEFDATPTTSTSSSPVPAERR